MALIENTAPAEEPVTRAEAVLWMRYVGSLQNDVIDSLIVAARKYVENWTGRTLVTTTWDYYTNQLHDEQGCDSIELPTGNAIAISAITYTDLDNATQTLTSSLYELDNKSVINTVYRAPNQTYPTVLDKPNSVKITFTAGYGAASAVPATMKTAIKMMVGQCYENREGMQMSELKENPTIKQLLNLEAKYRAG
jgi:uncharacterized phiE125 gp8 family phage protein